MSSLNGNARLLLRSLCLGALCMAILSLTPSVRAEEGAAGEEAAWAEITTLNERTPPPTLAPGERPTEDQIQAYMAVETERLEKLIEALAAYRTKYPEGEHAADTLKMLSETVDRAMAVSRGKSPKTLEMMKNLLAEKDLPESVGLALYRTKMISMSTMEVGAEDISPSDGSPPYAQKFQSIITEYEKRYPGSVGLFELQLITAQILEYMGDSESARMAYQAIADSDAEMDPQIKTLAMGALKRYEQLGKPVEIKFTAIDGREVDLSAMKGNVVLVDFWATWCGPCMAELPNVLKVYEQYHDKGFEIIGISFDEDQAALKKMLADKGMKWPQYFDGKGWDNELGTKFGVRSIPTMWLIGTDGLLKDVNAGQNLAGKVARMLGVEPVADASSGGDLEK